MFWIAGFFAAIGFLYFVSFLEWDMQRHRPRRHVGVYDEIRF